MQKCGDRQPSASDWDADVEKRLPIAGAVAADVELVAVVT